LVLFESILDTSSWLMPSAATLFLLSWRANNPQP
jgi:hypothetical protein